MMWLMAGRRVTRRIYNRPKELIWAYLLGLLRSAVSMNHDSYLGTLRRSPQRPCARNNAE